MFNKKEDQAKEPAKQVQESSGSKMIAKKDFVIHHNDVHIEIKKGDVIKVPSKFLPNLKTEGVI